ncbi:tubulin epsilon and delta complex protein 2 isoform X2 [Centroberyx affinis]|uniref:tubulin epsilon and delta complex protein 2 isoform X2 n=1 Tax=Centroberyx affinis TaxID=166261 RepID=UPI003A5C59BD
MSLLTAVEEAIKSCKAEQAKIDVNIHLYREILQTLTPQTKNVSQDSEFTDDAATDTDIPPGEKEEIELLERALEKALWIRAGTGPQKKNPDRNGQSGPHKVPGGAVVRPKEVTQASAASKGNQTTIRSTSKSTSLDRKEPKKPRMPVSGATAGHHPRQYKPGVNSNSIQKRPVSSADVVPLRAARKAQQAVSSSSSPDQGRLHASIAHSKYEAVRGSLQSDGELGKATATSMPTSKNPVSVSHTEGTGTQTSPQQNGIPSEQIANWKSLRSKQNRLWDKVIAVQRKPVPERSHFMARMRTTFPKDWPCGSPDQTRVLVDKLTHQGQDLTQYYQTKQLLAKQASTAGTEPGGKENKYESYPTLESLETMAAELQQFEDQVKREWEAWDRWRPEGGCLCPVGPKGEWGDGTVAPLPPTVSYTTEAELRELEKLRMRVALLQQQMYLQQALSDTLSPQLSSVVRGPGCPNPAVLRDLYSLLGEGGEQFPVMVLDTEPD